MKDLVNANLGRLPSVVGVLTANATSDMVLAKRENVCAREQCGNVRDVDLDHPALPGLAHARPRLH